MFSLFSAVIIGFSMLASYAAAVPGMIAGGFSLDENMPDIVLVAESQIGNKGGEQYWSWYGFDTRAEWCACFASWCADQCGYIETGAAPKFAGCVWGVQWFRDKGLWVDGTAVPEPGWMIFYDWDEGGRDGLSDHVGIVESVSEGVIYTVEGNLSDSVMRAERELGNPDILGYGIIVPP
ncbi:MAG: CHAP domain-containing protein [Oscillospiraceae bacterium]